MMRSMHRARHRVLGFALAATLATCGTSGSRGTTAHTSGRGHPATSAKTAAAPSPGTSTAPAVSVSPLAACPATQPESALAVLVRTGGAPDDLAATPAGLWASDEVRGTITSYGFDATVRLTMHDPRGPEGLLVFPDGRLVVGEQVSDRIVVLHPPDPTPSTVLQLRPLAGHDGVDGIGVDASGGNLLVPDSARGTLLQVPLDGAGNATVLASGLGRPVAATVAADGRMYVAAEGRPGLWRVPAGGGTPVAVGAEDDLDEVVGIGPLLYVTSLAGGTVRVVDPVNGEARTLVSGGAQLQGLTAMTGGRLALADSARGEILTLPGCPPGAP